MARLPDGTSVEVETLVALLRRWTGVDPDADLFSFLPDGDATGEVVLTRGELDRRARDLAVRLASRGLAGERALLLYPAGLEFIVAFFGCLYAASWRCPPTRRGPIAR